MGLTFPNCGLTSPLTKDTDAERNSQHLQNNSSHTSPPFDTETATQLFDRLVDLCLTPTPTRSSCCDPSQINLLIKQQENKEPSVDLSDLAFSGTYTPNSLIDRPAKNGDLVISFSLPSNYPYSKEKLVHWTRGILRGRLPLGVISILAPERALDLLAILQSARAESTRSDEPLWGNSIVFFDCNASWEPDPSRIHSVVYKINHRNQQIAVLRVDEEVEEHKQHLDSNRVCPLPFEKYCIF